ncbi:hypothetical protein WJX84_007497 [Apatococcus fuscideae]|uniref:STAS domain-containing protein n=1 Tax=Apatococcus fuscideae TaxID=2026836 RepID=A0AAW1THK7_9CHLO
MSAQNPRVKTLKANGETLTRAATARDGELVVETVPLQRAHSATDKDPRQRFWGSFTKGQKGSQRQLNQAALQVAPAIAVNLRDIGKVSDIVKSGILFRSSELISAQEVQRYNVQTVVDLRRMDRPCKQSVNVHERRLRKLWHDIRMVIPEDKKPYAARGMPNACSSCSERFSERHEHTCEVMHADFIPGRVGLHIFQAMPASIRCQAILAALTGKGAASVMAPAVANPAYMGYKVLYKTVLDKSKRGIAKAIRVLRDSRNFPVLVHCIHGKDRTGLLVMLILLLCNIPPSEIVKDYMLSETVLKESRMHQELHLDTYLTSDDVIAATRDCMEDTITYVNGKLGGINAYLKTCLAAVFTAGLVAVVMAFIMPVFAYLPMNVLAAIITSSLVSNLEIAESTYLFKINKLDWSVWMTSFLGTVFLGVEIGLTIAIGLALMLVVYESAFPGLPILGRLPDSHVYRNMAQYPNAEADKRVTVMRIDAPIYFANVEYIKDYVKMGHQKEQDPDDRSLPLIDQEDLKFLVLDMSAVTYIDTAGLRGLEQLLAILGANDIQLLMADPSQAVMAMMDMAGLTDIIGREHLFVEVHDAVQHAHEDLSRISMELRNCGTPPHRSGQMVLHGQPLRPSADKQRHHLSPLV